MVSAVSKCIGLAISFVGIVVGNATGAGAGGFVVPCLFIFFNYKIVESVALWNAVTLIVSGWRFIYALKSRERHPEGNKSIIDFNSVLIFLPLLFIGIECGFITMSILPEGVKLIIFTLMLFILTGFTVRKAYIKRRKESSAKESLIINVSIVTDSVLLADEAELYFPVKKIALNGVAFLLLTATHLLLGSRKAASIVGIELCSFEYWFGLFIYFSLLILLLWYNYKLVKRERAKNIERNIMPLPSEFEWTVGLIRNIALLSVLSGFFSSSYGVGGAVILNMILIYKGVNPEVVTSTTMLSVVSTCLSTTAVYSISGILPIDVYSITLLVLSLPLTIISYKYLKKVLSKHGSIILFVLAGALGVSGMLIVTFGFYKENVIDGNKNIWSFGSACHS